MVKACELIISIAVMSVVPRGRWPRRADGFVDQRSRRPHQPVRCCFSLSLPATHLQFASFTVLLQCTFPILSPWTSAMVISLSNLVMQNRMHLILQLVLLWRSQGHIKLRQNWAVKPLQSWWKYGTKANSHAVNIDKMLSYRRETALQGAL